MEPAASGERALLDGLRSKPGSARNWLDLAQSLWRSGGKETARKLIQKALGLSVAEPELLRQAAFLLEEDGDFELSDACLARSLAAEPNCAQTRLQRARLIWRCSSLAPDGGRDSQARLHWALGRLPEAWRAMERALARGTPSEWAMDQAFAFFVETGEFGRAEACLSSLSRTSAAAAAGLAQLRLWEGRARESLALSQRALKLDPSCAAAKRARLGALVLSGRLAMALRAAGAMLRRDPRDAVALIWRGEALRLCGRRAEAKRALDAAARRGHESTGLVFSRALLEEPRAGSAWRRFLAAAHEGMRGNRSGVETFLSRGRLQRTPLRPKAADDGYDNDSDPNTAPALVAGFLLRGIRSRSPEALIADFTALISERPDEPEFRAHRGEVRLWLGQYEEALKDFEAVGRLKNARLWWMVAQAGAWMLSGRAAAAFERLGEAEREGALVTAIAPWRGECLRLLGRPAEVPAELSKARARFPFHVSTWINLALAYRDMGQVEAHQRLADALRRQAPNLLADAGGLEEALALMRGNRSSICPTYFPPGGRIKVADLLAWR